MSSACTLVLTQYGLGLALGDDGRGAPCFAQCSQAASARTFGLCARRAPALARSVNCKTVQAPRTIVQWGHYQSQSGTRYTTNRMEGVRRPGVSSGTVGELQDGVEAVLVGMRSAAQLTRSARWLKRLRGLA